MSTIKIPKEDLKTILYNNEAISENIIDHTRWSVHYEMIFPYQGKFYKTFYSVGATESQDERPFEYADDLVDCVEVHKVSRTMEVWEEVK